MATKGLNRDCNKCVFFRHFHNRGPHYNSHGWCQNKAHIKIVRQLDTCDHFKPC